MMPEPESPKHAIALVKFLPRKYARRLVNDGELHFSLALDWIKQGYEDQNNKQGDPYEGVSGHLGPDDYMREEPLIHIIPANDGRR